MRLHDEREINAMNSGAASRASFIRSLPQRFTKRSHRILNSKQSLIIKENIFQRWFTDFDGVF